MTPDQALDEVITAMCCNGMVRCEWDANGDPFNIDINQAMSIIILASEAI